MKYIQFFLAAMFIFFASLQFNDPDPVRWVMIYGFTAIVSIFTALEETRSYFYFILISGLVISGIWMASMMPDFFQWIGAGAPDIFSSWREGSLMVELVREFLGLTICTIVIGYDLHIYTARRAMQGMQKAVA